MGNVAHEDGSMTIDNASVQRLMDYGLLHRTDDGWHVGPWPETNSPAQPVQADMVEQVTAEIESYGEGLVPELRIVCVWLAAHFRNNEDARAALLISRPDRLRDLLAPIAAVVADYEKDGYSDRYGDDEAILGRIQWKSANYPGADELPPRVTWGQLKAIRTALDEPKGGGE